jgi:hypothetical protein
MQLSTCTYKMDSKEINEISIIMNKSTKQLVGFKN